MRYLIEFKDPNVQPKRVSQREGEVAMRAKNDGANVVIRGAMFDPVMISAIKPISTDYFGKDYVEAEERKELANPEELKYLKSVNSPQLTDGNTTTTG